MYYIFTIFLLFQVLTSFLLLVVAANAQGNWNYNDVDLRIAERRAIPHYIRHGVEYPEIDIKAIMRQRGLQPRPPTPRTTPRITTRPSLTMNRNFRKSYAMSNHIEPPHTGYIKKRKQYSKYAGKYYKKQRYD